jgi:hypothetical protein
MALPDDTLSSTPVPGSFIGAAAQPITRAVDYEDGPSAIRDPVNGLNFQQWRARIFNNNQILVSAPNTPEYVFHSGPAITDVSIAFDQNANLYCVYVQQGTTYLYWFDTIANDNVTTNYGTTWVTPKITLDDKRATQNARSDVILTYVRDGKLYYRQQRDRFQIERLLDDGPIVGIEKFGKNDGYRLQWLLSRD